MQPVSAKALRWRGLGEIGKQQNDQGEWMQEGPGMT